VLRLQQQQRLGTPAVQQYQQHGLCQKLQWRPAIQQQVQQQEQQQAVQLVQMVGITTAASMCWQL
jgi:hypothetical protein